MNGSSVIGQIFSVIGVILAFILILYLAYISTRILGKRMSIKGTKKNIKVLETLSFGQGKSVAVIQSAGKTLLIGITNEQITLVSELDPEKLEKEPEAPETMEFSQAFKKVLEKNFGKKIGSKEKKK
ncbi:MAG: FliO/MopB family protein [Porcipelethomonas sp.]